MHHDWAKRMEDNKANWTNLIYAFKRLFSRSSYTNSLGENISLAKRLLPEWVQLTTKRNK